MKQQEQAKTFFKDHAFEWQKKASDRVYNVIDDRHRAVHKTLSNYKKNSSLLDIGCGTGQLAIEAVANGYFALGVDFAEEMIEQAKINALKSKSSAKFEIETIFDFYPKNKFDVISAMGFIEYISLQQLDFLLNFCYKNTNNKGSVSIGSRNRLFNLTTFNEYTKLEEKLGSINELMDESSICFSSENKIEFLNAMRNYIGSAGLIQNESHPLTSIGVETRYQFTPSDLMHRIEKHGFEVTNIYPVNYHAFSPSIKKEEIFLFRKNIAKIVSEEYQTDFSLIPNSSSFVMEAIKIDT
ncbi:class I SAM-dependent methyltransferase [Alphaproteobacteria bacterium]|nr:class I SAM-dependent methyltransferase [Alphaproteobacteria bacterium]